MPKIKRKKEDRRVDHAAKENTRLKGAELISSFYSEDRPRSESGSFNSNPFLSFSNMLRTPSPDVLSLSVQLIEDEDKKESPLQITPKGKRNISRLCSSRRSAFFNRSKNCVSPVYFSNDRIKRYNSKGDNDSPIERDAKETEENKENICETPKIRYDSLNLSKRDANLEVVSVKKDVQESKNQEKVCFARTKSQTEVLHLQGIININPYMDYQIAQVKNNKDNVNELSFFTPDLLESKPASTPIHAVNEKVQSKLPFNDISNTSSMTNRTRNLRDSVLRRSALTPVIIEEPLPKQTEIEDELDVQRKVTEFLSYTAPVGDIGTTKNVAKIAKAFGRTKNQRSDSYKSLVEASSSKDNTLGAVKKVLKGVHRYGAVTAKWTMSLFSVCMRLGFNVKPKITAEPCTHFENSRSDKTCVCHKYQEDINNLKSKIEELNNGIGDLQMQLLESIQKNRKVETLNATLEELSKDVENLKLMRDEMDNLRNRFNTMSFTTIPPTPMSTARAAAPAAAPPPPPPPPPPLPPAPPLLPQVNKVTTLKKSSKEANCDTPRPVISLDDILKVKLKKTSERSATLRRSTGNQPEVTRDMLQQVKLRKPLCRSMTTSRLPVSMPPSPEGSSGSISPHSSLKRLLRDDASFRIKRLKRSDGYSFNDKRNRLSRERQ